MSSRNEFDRVPQSMVKLWIRVKTPLWLRQLMMAARSHRIMEQIPLHDRNLFRKRGWYE